MDRVTTKRPPAHAEAPIGVEHGIPSIDMHWQAKGKLYDHAGDHRKQREVALGAVGDLVAVTHAHELTALPQLQVRAVASALLDCSTARCAAAQRLHRPITAGHAVHGAAEGGPTW